ncbi:ATP-binding protein [Streptomyces sp. NPDC059994]|uniref:ATP-binding protein n=1 Tax=Streptomyces sp. NPDC059994 TaxID=3347029 RepID=UPI00369C6AAA
MTVTAAATDRSPTASLPREPSIADVWARPLPGAEVCFTRQGEDALTPQDRKWPRCCRGICRELLSGWGLDALSDTGALVVSELVTNALQHGCAGSPISMALTRCAEVVRIEVINCAPPWELRHDLAGLDGESGRGLLMVESASDAFGIGASGGRTRVWCELALPAGEGR